MRFGPWIQDPDIVINATTPAAIETLLTAAGHHGHRLDGAEAFRATEATGQTSGDVAFFPGYSTFDGVCEGAPEAAGPTVPRPAGLAAVWSENDALDPAGSADAAGAFRFAYDTSNPDEPQLFDMPEDDPLTSIGSTVLKPFGTGADNIVVGVANTVLDLNLFWLIAWDMPTSSHWPTGALDIQMDPARVDAIYDGGLVGSADLGLKFTNKTVDHYGFYRYWPWTDTGYDHTQLRWHSTTDPAGIAGSDTFELRLAPADLPVGSGSDIQPIVTATQLAAWSLLGDAAIAPTHSTAPAAHATGTASPYDYTNAADQTPFDLAITVDSMGARVVCALASQRTKTQPADPAEGEMLVQDDGDGFHWQVGRANFVAVDGSPDGHTVQSVQLTWRPPRYRFAYAGVTPLRQRQTSTGVHTAGTPLRQRQHHFGLRQRQTGIGI